MLKGLSRGRELATADQIKLTSGETRKTQTLFGRERERRKTDHQRKSFL